MAEEKFNGDIPEMVVDFDASDVLYPDNMDVANEVVVETYFQQQQQGQLENLVNASEVSTVQPLVHEGYAIPDIRDYAEQDNSIVVLGNALQNAFDGEQREMLEIKSNPEDSGIFTTHSEEVNINEVMIATNSQPNRADLIIDQKIISENQDMEITKEVSLEHEDKFDPDSAEINMPLVVRHQTEMKNSGKPELTRATDGDDDADDVHSDSQSPNIASEESSPPHRMLTRSAAKAAKSTSHSAEIEKTPKKRKISETSSASNGDTTSARSARTSLLAKKVTKKPKRSRMTHK
ncbi:unnamed protein product [Cercopithifilaria johnstoni]|uniref:Uncharacterized protein n=1 Tax=Cercopithifilaria johnstoni TaxID=2874296 RepID=A0A8J2LZA0_9BILA|nr:unnamed protein product [Cercopithifilaria johnstoni]